MKTKNIILITLGVFATAVTTFFIVNHFNNDEDKNITADAKNATIEFIRN